MTFWLSRPAETLHRQLLEEPEFIADYVIVGSGYGAAMAALALTDQIVEANGNVKSSILVLEKGDEYLPDDFPKTLDVIPRELSVKAQTSANQRDQNIKNNLGLFEFTQGDGISILSGSGLGGTSLINANVAAEPDSEVLKRWDDELDDGTGVRTDFENTLPQYFDKIRDVLGAQPLASADSNLKYVALKKTVAGIQSIGDGKLKGSVKPACLTINELDNRSNRKYKHSVKHGPCNHCGNCFVGCHSGAKQSLNLNVWPLALQRGVQLYSGVVVQSLEKTHKKGQWQIHARSSRNQLIDIPIKAKHVILAAGTLGSVEILQRSSRNLENPLKVSQQLGKRFSANGDALITSVGQSARVNSLAGQPHANAFPNSGQVPTGPTIVGIATVEVPLSAGTAKITLEDGAIPYALIPLWQEVNATQSFIYRYESSKLTSWHRNNPGKDYLAASQELSNHSQLLLVMGDDGAKGELQFVCGTKPESDNNKNYDKFITLPKWPAQTLDDESKDFFLDLNTTFDGFNATHSDAVFDGGQYYPNPMWKLLPNRFGKEVAGAEVAQNNMVSVHPLGGCSMGSSTLRGVVNPNGQVFTGNLNDVKECHESLYVLDGATVPGAIGVNPFLTICALSYHLARKIVGDDKEPPEMFEALNPSYNPLPGKAGKSDDWMSIPSGKQTKIPKPNEQTVSGEFKERFVHFFERKSKAGLPWSPKSGLNLDSIRKVLGVETPENRAPEDTNNIDYNDPWRIGQAMVLDTCFFLDGADSIDKWLEQPNRKLRAQATLRVDLRGSVLKITDAHLSEPLAHLTGYIQLGKLDSPKNSIDRSLRTLQAILKFIIVRPYNRLFWRFLIGFFLALSATIFSLINWPWQSMLGLIALAGELARRGHLRTAIDGTKGYWRTAQMHTDWREMVYQFCSDPKMENQFDIVLAGKKSIAYSLAKPDFMRSLMTVETKLTSNDTGKTADITWEMDAVRTTEGPAVLQIKDSLQLLSSLVKLSSVGAYYMRMLFQTHFWSLGAHDYKQIQTQKKLDEPDKVESRLYPPPEYMRYGKNQKSQSKETYFWHEDPELRIGPSGHYNDEPMCQSASIGDPSKPQQLCRLVRYQPEDSEDNEQRPVILLVHGLAHSSRVFWAHTIKENLVQYFLRQNYDVWIVDHRTSANYVEKVNPRHTWDQVAHHDMPWAVHKIYKTINEGIEKEQPSRKIHVFAHCIGAGAMSMAILDGRLQDTQRKDENGTMPSMLASFVPHAVTPWLVASVENRARENVWEFFKNLELYDVVEPFPHNNTKFAEMVLDRLATAFLNDEEDMQWCQSEAEEYASHDEIKRSFWKSLYFRCIDTFFDPRGPGFARAIYSRYTIIWGRQWWNKNVNRKTRFDFSSMIGATPIDVMQQVYFSVTRGMLSNHEGNNVYVKSDNIAAYWTMPTLFFHGNKNTVFDMESSKQSARMLTLHRTSQQLGANSDDSYWQKQVIPKQMAEQNVWLEIIDNYGHMDVIFGQHANRDIYPKLSHFFNNAEPVQSGEPAPYFSECMQKTDSGLQKRMKSRAHVGPIKRPLTGPIISRPQVIDEDGHKKIKLNLWCEIQDFTSTPFQYLSMQTGEFTKGALRRRTYLDRSSSIINPPQSYQTPPQAIETVRDLDRIDVDEEFWLREYIFDADIDQPIYLWASRKKRQKLKKRNKIRTGPRPQTAVRLNWHDLDWFKRLANIESKPNSALSFLIGSCFYPGTTFDNQQSFGVFKGMMKHVTGHELEVQGVDHVLFLGDQIYADSTANVFDPKTGYEKYRNRYRQAWSSKIYPEESAARILFSHVPTYFCVDDHEYNDNFQGVIAEADRKNYLYALRMASLYQIHTPTWHEPIPPLFQDFESAGYPFFVFDTRMERKPSDEFSRNEAESLLSKKQLRSFVDWLKKANDPNDAKDVLFIASGSPIIPIERDELTENDLLRDGDRLTGYPGFLKEVVANIRKYAATKYICWLTGDPHIACYAELQFGDSVSDEEPVNILQVCSSGVYAPLIAINTNPTGVCWNQAIDITLPDSTLKIISEGQTLITDHRQHFLRIDLADDISQKTNPRLTFGAFDAQGKAVSKSFEHQFSRALSSKNEDI